MFQWSSNRRPISSGHGNDSSTSSRYTREQHIDSYINDASLKRSTRKIPPGDSKFDTVFQTVRGHTLILRVSIENLKLPSMTLAGVKATHPWLDSRMRVTGYSPLQSESAWTNAHLLLGTAVHNVVQELQVRPPDIEAIVDPNLQNIQSKQSKHRKTGANESDRSQMKNDAPPTYSSALFKPTPKVDMPEVSSQFSELSALSREELDTLLNNELDFQAFCSKLPVLKNLQALSISVIDDNAKAADKALENESKLQALQSEAKMYQAQLSEAVERFKALEKKQNDLCKPPDHRRVTRELTKAKKLAFDKSERLADEWLENDAVDVDTFLQEFLDERKRHHSQGAKLELLESK